MPNHVHGILFLRDEPTLTPQPLGIIVGNYKASVTREARRSLNQTDPIWQSRYHDHIIRDEAALQMIRDYVQQNPQRWQVDTFYSAE